MFSVISSTPSSLNKKNLSFTPVLLKTMELSYVARRSGMTPIVLGKPHMSPLKPALKNTEQDKGTKRRNIHFETPKTTSDQFVTPENSCNGKYCRKMDFFMINMLKDNIFPLLHFRRRE